MGLKLGQKLNFQPFLCFCSVSGRDTGRDINSGRDIKSGRDILPDSNLFFFSNLSGP